MEIARRRSLSYEQFMEEFDRPGLPVVIEDLALDWPAMQWTPEALAERCGSVNIKVSKASKDGEKPIHMTLAEYVRYMAKPSTSRPWYLTSWDFTEECPHLKADIRLPRYFAEDLLERLDPAIRPRLLWIFMGPPGSGFKLHVDIGHTAAWNAQLRGVKEWILYAPDDEPLLYEGEPDAFAPDLKRFPKLQQARPWRTSLKPGEVIFVPSRWWHQTRILETSVSVTGNYANENNLSTVLAWLRNSEHAPLASALEAVAL